MRGRVFEKVGVNVSTVCGRVQPRVPPPDARVPSEDGRFWASGISLVAHLRSPHVPPVHMNTRHIRTGSTWFGGGADLNPIYPDERRHGGVPRPPAGAPATPTRPMPTSGSSTWGDEYFFLPHRGEPRGVGGIFYDYLEGDFERISPSPSASARRSSTSIRRSSGATWIAPGPRPSASTSWSAAAATSSSTCSTTAARMFGLKTGGNTEAILMSLPPVVAWP